MEDGVDPHEEFLGEGAGDHVLNIVAHVKEAGFLTGLVVALGVGLVRVLQGHVVASERNDLCSGVKVELVECCSFVCGKHWVMGQLSEGVREAARVAATAD
jgi:hypothetical protein